MIFTVARLDRNTQTVMKFKQPIRHTNKVGGNYHRCWGDKNRPPNNYLVNFRSKTPMFLVICLY